MKQWPPAETVLQRFVLVYCSVLLTVIGLETGFRTYGAIRGIDLRLYATELVSPNRLPPDLFVPDPLIVGRLNPGRQFLATTSDFSVIYTINSLGLRDREYAYERTPGKTRILALGDSFTFGEGVPYGRRFTDIPENTRTDLEILNFGMPGMALDTIMLNLLAEGKKYRPDYVMVFLNTSILNRTTYSYDELMSQDFFSEHSSKMRDDSGSTVYMERGGAARYRLLKNIDRSYLASYLWYRITLLRLRNDFAQKDKRAWSPAASGVSTQPATRPFANNPDRNREILERMTGACAEIDCRLILINIERQPLDLPEIYAENLYFDFSKDLQQLNPQTIGFTYDLHYNPETHAVLGNALSRVIQYLLSTDNK